MLRCLNLIGNISVMFDERVLPKGINCAPLRANLFNVRMRQTSYRCTDKRKEASPIFQFHFVTNR